MLPVSLAKKPSNAKKNHRRLVHFSNLMHAVDWVPTLISAAGYPGLAHEATDGVDMWESISNEEEGPRTEVVYNIKEKPFMGAIRPVITVCCAFYIPNRQFDLRQGMVDISMQKQICFIEFINKNNGHACPVIRTQFII